MSADDPFAGFDPSKIAAPPAGNEQPQQQMQAQQEEPAKELPETAAVMQAVHGQGSDELSVAIREAARPKTTAIPKQPKHVPKYALAYSLGGTPIIETHATIPHALASIRRLKALGIIPATKTL